MMNGSFATVLKRRFLVDRYSSTNGYCDTKNETIKVYNRAAEGNELHKLASAKLGEVESPLQSYLEKEFSNSVSRQRATSLMLHVLGMRVYGYQQGSADRM
jgi:hypothetical protein